MNFDDPARRMALDLKGNWTKCSDKLPPQDTEVETKIDDARGVRNVAALKLHGRLWFFPDMGMYIYYEPTHWREV